MLTSTTPAATTDGGGVEPLAYVGPNWFAAVMGTGILANAVVTLPVHSRMMHAMAVVTWGVAATLLVCVILAFAGHRLTHPQVARGHVDHPVMGHFYGAPAMALMTVGAGTLLLGRDVLGLRAALAVDAVLWSTGTVMGLWTLCAIPRRTLRRAEGYAGPAFGGWLMPVVPPMVSATTGALLAPHLSPAHRPWMIVVCGAMFLAAAVASAPLLGVIVGRTLSGAPGAATAVPTLFIVLGPLGQSVTAAHALAEQAGGAWPRLALLYGAPVLLAAACWTGVAVTVLVRTARTGLPFAMTWWSFTFPLGTVVTGTSAVATATGSHAVGVVAVLLFGTLCAAWSVVATGTVRGVLDGELLRPPQTA